MQILSKNRRSSRTSCGWLLDTAGAGVGELKRLPDSMGNTPGVVEEPIEPIDEPMKEGISPMGAAGENVAVMIFYGRATWGIHRVSGWWNNAVKGCDPGAKNRVAPLGFLWWLWSSARL